MSLVSKNSSEIKAVTPSLEDQRLALRRQLADQREVIAFRLTPGNQLQRADTDNSTSLTYPRSLTMRLLRQNPEPVIKLAVGLVTWLLGKRFSGVLQEGMQFLKMVRMGATLR